MVFISPDHKALFLGAGGYVARGGRLTGYNGICIPGLDTIIANTTCCCKRVDG